MRRKARGGDGTGPAGMGPGTGRGLGPCVRGQGTIPPGAQVQQAPVGLGRGLGRGFGLGMRTVVDVCPQCGFTVPHERGVPAINKQCPECGSRMVGGNGCRFVASELLKVARLLIEE